MIKKLFAVAAVSAMLCTVGYAQFVVKSKPQKSYTDNVNASFTYPAGSNANSTIASKQTYKNIMSAQCPAGFVCTLYITIATTPL